MPNRNGSHAVSGHNGSMQVSAWDPSHKLHPFFGALRDRLITFFEVKDLTHKPKLIAVTSCSTGSGVTTIAAGVAASLSETGDGTVLLVNMRGPAQEFHHGEPGYGLDDALHDEKRGGALKRENLYIVSENHPQSHAHTNGNGKTNGFVPQAMPKRFKHFVPRLKASDYDYIIFDMPPVSQISLTPAVARFMDMVLIVVESEKTDREIVRKAVALLSESKANLVIILNRSRTYLPRKLGQDVL